MLPCTVILLSLLCYTQDAPTSEPEVRLQGLGAKIDKRFDHGKLAGVAVDLSFTAFDDSQLELLNKVKLAESINFSYTKVSDLSSLDRDVLKGLKSLSLGGTRPNKSSSAIIGTCVNLKDLSLYDTDVDDDFFNQLPVMPNIVFLSLSKSLISDASVKVILQKFPALEKLDLSGCTVTDECCGHFATAKVGLLLLNNTKLSDKGLVAFAGAKKLHTLYVHNSQITSRGVANLRRTKPIIVFYDK